MNNILLVEDEASVASLIIRSLAEEGYEVSLAPDGQTGLDMATQNSFDLLILDIMLPGINGLGLCKRIRANGDTTPILMLTALGTTQNIVAGLDSGADDYLVKPYKLAELLARVRSMIRRGKGSAAASDTEKIKVADLELNLQDKTATRSGQKIDLTATEYRLLKYLMTNARRLVSRMDMLEHVWGVDFNMNTKVVDVYVNYLRKKIDKDHEQKLIHTVVGMGYILKPE
ncbi:MAG: DNA-binding response regulator [Bacteroidetes bacterium 43-93]|nr:response regulator transcription factor [Bacteroidota bacterium]OJX00539.1 MAG: DNA-binding response regulator [Bacteroidetes bacterium 43-93]